MTALGKWARNHIEEETEMRRSELEMVTDEVGGRDSGYADNDSTAVLFLHVVRLAGPPYSKRFGD